MSTAELDIIDVQTSAETALIRTERIFAVLAALMVSATLAAGWPLTRIMPPEFWALFAGIWAVSTLVALGLRRSYQRDAKWITNLLSGPHPGRITAVWFVAGATAVLLTLVAIGAAARLVWDLRLPWWALPPVISPFIGSGLRLWPERRRFKPHYDRWHGVILRRLEEEAASDDE